MLFCTTNNTADSIDEVANDELVSTLTLTCWPGQSDVKTVRFSGESEYGEVSISCDDPRVSFSLDSIHFETEIEYSAAGLGPVVWIRCTAPDDQIEETTTVAVMVGDEVFPIDLVLASTNDGESARTPFDRYQDERSRLIRDKFNTLGEVVTLTRYTPLDPSFFQLENAYAVHERDNLNVAQRVNPWNDLYWQKDVFRCRAFVGSRAISQAAIFNQDDPEVTFQDNTRIVIDPEFFSPFIVERVSVGEVNPDVEGFLETVWTLARNDREYHLSTISGQTFFKGSFLFYHSDLTLIQYPGAGGLFGYLPWGIVRDHEGKPITYIRSHVTNRVMLDEYGATIEWMA